MKLILTTVEESLAEAWTKFCGDLDKGCRKITIDHQLFIWFYAEDIDNCLHIVSDDKKFNVRHNIEVHRSPRPEESQSAPTTFGVVSPQQDVQE